MTKPLRTFLLNEQISIEARKIAHEYINTCCHDFGESGDEYHTTRCNNLRDAIQALCKNIKLAGMQKARHDARNLMEATRPDCIGDSE